MALERVVKYSDDFNRSNQPLTNSADWELHGELSGWGSLQITSNQVRRSGTTSVGMCNYAPTSDDYWFEVQLTSAPASGEYAYLLAGSETLGAGSDWLMFRWVGSAGGSSWDLQDYQSTAVLASGSGTPSSGTVIRCEFSGSNFKLYWDDVLKADISITRGDYGRYSGFAAYHVTDSAENYFDNFKIGVWEDTTRYLTTTDVEATHGTQPGAVGVSHALASLGVRSTGQVESAVVQAQHALAAAGTRANHWVESASVGVSHALAAAGVRANHQVDSAAVGQEQGLAASGARSTGQVESAAVDVTHALAVAEARANHRVESASVGVSHALATTGTRSDGQVDSAAIGATHALTTTGTQAAGQVQDASVGVSHALATPGTRSDGQIDAAGIGATHALACAGLQAAGQIEGAAVSERAPQTGTWIAIPVATVDAVDIYDENDQLAGADAHESIADQTDTRWLRQDYSDRADSYAHLSFDSGLPDGVDVTTIDTVEVSLWLAMMGAWVDDLLSISIRIVRPDGTPLTDEILGSNAGGLTSEFVRFDDVFTGVVNDATAWNDARVQFHWTKDRTGKEDDCAIAVSQLYLHGTYTAGFTHYNLEVGSHVERVEIEVTQTLEAAGAQSVGQVGAGALGQEHSLAATDVASAHTVDAAAIGLSHALLSESVQAPHQVATAEIGQSHALSPGDTQSAGAIEAAGVSTTHTLATGDVQAEGAVESGAVGVTPNLIAADVQSLGAVQAGAVSTAHHLTSAAAQSTGQVERASVSLEHALAASSVRANHQVERVVLEGAAVLETSDVQSEPFVVAGSIEQHRVVRGRPLGSAGQVEAAAIRQEHGLQTTGLRSTGSVESGRIGAVQDLIPANVAALHAVESGRVVTGAAIEVACPTIHDRSEVIRLVDASVTRGIVSRSATTHLMDCCKLCA